MEPTLFSFVTYKRNVKYSVKFPVPNKHAFFYQQVNNNNNNNNNNNVVVGGGEEGSSRTVLG